MQFAYDLLTGISFQHNYYQSNKFYHFTVVPEKDTERVLISHGFVWKQYANGFRLLYDTLFCGRKRTYEEVVAASLKLRFLLYNNDIQFFNYTAFCHHLNLSETALHFSNSGEREFHERLHINEYVNNNVDNISAAAISSSNGLKKPFAVIDVHTDCVETKEYIIQFQSRLAYWRYIVAAEHLLEIEKLYVINKRDNSVFDGPVKYVLPDGRKALLFTSKQLLSFSERSDRELQLVEKYNAETGRGKVVIGRLPNPDIRHLSVTDFTLSSKDRMKYADIIL